MQIIGRTLAAVATFIIVALILAGCQAMPEASRGGALMPQPIADNPGERGQDFRARREAWIEHLHRAAPDVDWRQQDAVFRAARFERREYERALRLERGASPADLRNVQLQAISGTWAERGSSNQAGRVTAAALDATNNRLTVLSHGGNVWRASRALLDWTSPNDGARFSPVSDAGFLQRLAGGSGERLLAASDSPTGIFRSDNGGLTWAANAGTALANPWYTMGLTARDETQNDVYLLRVHFDSGAAMNWRPHLFSSTDRGTTFTSRGFIGQRDTVSIFSPRYDHNNVYVLSGNEVSTITPGTHALALLSTITLGFTLTNEDRAVLTGGFSGGQVFLYAFYSRRSTGNTAVFRSLDGGVTWSARTAVPTTLMTANSAESSTNDPLRAYAGGVNAYRTADGGASWILINDWTAYYGAPASKLHADIPNIDVWRTSGGAERVYISTDGGLYESTDHAATVQNLNLSGMNVSQYYGSYTRRSAPYQVLVGAQDQGYQKALAPTGAIDSYVQTISGDYAHLESTDGGNQVWMVYPGFVMVDTSTTSSTQAGLVSWDFATNNFTAGFFLPALAVDPSNAARMLLAGGNLSGSGQRLVQLTRSGGSISHSEIPFDFGTKVTAVAYASDGGTRYAINDNAQFFRQIGVGAWGQTSSGLPDNHFFFGNRILVDPVTAGKIYVAGSGYSNPGVHVSTNNGNSFVAMSTGLPNTMVFDLAISSNGQHLFAATEVGPYYFDTGTNSWQDLGALGAPEQQYWDVDFVDAQNIARFSTYGRGIWDFVLAPTGVLFGNGFE